MSKIKLINFFLIFILVSCSTSKDVKNKKKISKKEISQKFDIDEELLEKFETNDTEVLEQDNSKHDEDLKPSEKTSKLHKSKPIKKTQMKTKKRSSQKKLVTSSPNSSIEKEELSSHQTDEENLGVQHPEFIDLDRESQRIWELFDQTSLNSFKYLYDISYMGVKAGELTLSLIDEGKTISNQKVLQFRGRIKSNSFYSYIYEVDDTLNSFFSKEKFIPIKFQMDQVESNFVSKELMLFDHESKTSYFFYQKKTEDSKVKKKKKVINTPTYFQDPFSVLFFLKGIDWTKVGGKRLSIPLVNGKKILLLNSFLEKKETLSIEGERVEAIKVIAQTKYKGDTLKSGDLIFWFSADANKDLLKLRVKVKLGSIMLEKVKNLQSK